MWWGGGKQQGVLWKMCKLANSATRLPTLFLRLFPSSRHFLTEKLWGRVVLKLLYMEPFKVHKYVKKMSKAFFRCQGRSKFTSLGCLQEFSTYVQVCMQQQELRFFMCCEKSQVDDFSR